MSHNANAVNNNVQITPWTAMRASVDNKRRKTTKDEAEQNEEYRY